MGELADAIKRAAEKLKDPNFQPPDDIEPLDLPAIPEAGECHVTCLQERGKRTPPTTTGKADQQ